MAKQTKSKREQYVMSMPTKAGIQPMVDELAQLLQVEADKAAAKLHPGMEAQKVHGYTAVAMALAEAIAKRKGR